MVALFYSFTSEHNSGLFFRIQAVSVKLLILKWDPNTVAFDIVTFEVKVIKKSNVYVLRPLHYL